MLVISAGSMGKLAARALAEAGGAQIIVANRTRERAQELAAEMGPGVQATALADLHDTLSGADIVISGTAAEGFIVRAGDVMSVMAGRNGRGLLFIDIAVPRDIDPAVAEVHGVHLFDIDDIEAVTASGMNGREREVERVETIIDEEVTAFLDWWRSLDVVPVIAALRERAETIRRQEVERTLGRLTELDDESEQRIEAMTAAIVKKMLDRPIARLKTGRTRGCTWRRSRTSSTCLRPDPVRSREAADVVSSRTLVVGSRGSRLALRQAEIALEALRSGASRSHLRSPNDSHYGRSPKASLSEIGGRGVFVIEIERALLAGEIDIAVHSLKDLPTDETPGLAIAAVLPREDPRDVLVSRRGARIEDLRRRHSSARAAQGVRRRSWR